MSDQQYNDLKRAKRDLAVLYEVSSAMRTTLELNQILYIILTGVTSHSGLGFNRAILFMVNHQTRALEPQMAIGPDSAEHAQKIWEFIEKTDKDIDDLINHENPPSYVYESAFYQSIKNLTVSLDTNNDNLLSDAFHVGNPMHITEEKLKAYSNDTLLKKLNTKELVIMPLKAKDKVTGLIVADNLYSQAPITKDDLRLFMMLANQAGLAIENSQLYEMVRLRGQMDAITELWNHGFFQHQLRHEIKEHQNHTQMLTLLLIDIDNFKKINDAYGHQFGDKVLKDIATILKNATREKDFVCRYGGEEFSIILTKTDVEQGKIHAERVRNQVEQHHFISPTDGQEITITVSIGLATYPEHAKSKEELISRADRAMYISKFSGKNQVTVADDNTD